MTWSTGQPTPSSRLPVSSCKRGLRRPARPATEPGFPASSRTAAGAVLTEGSGWPRPMSGPTFIHLAPDRGLLSRAAPHPSSGLAGDRLQVRALGAHAPVGRLVRLVEEGVELRSQLAEAFAERGLRHH